MCIFQCVRYVVWRGAPSNSTVGDAPRLGVPADWTSSHQYKVTAANGVSKIWTISVVLNK
ncbi:DUF5018-related domain-containing protein [Prevotella illustrans]|uniref:DUF5018-related domain-containing protein n=1 Tax=Prevotella illustrans TaxID=2800387 RepID=UPI00374391F5